MVQQGKGRDRAGVVAGAALALAGLVGAGGCSARAGAAADDRAGADMVRQAADALAAARSSKVVTSMTMASGGTRVTIRGEGGFDFVRRTGQLRVVLPKDAAGAEEHRPITEVLTPAAVYMKNRGANVPADQWVEVEPAKLPDGNLVTNGATDPLVAAELLRGAHGVTYVGREELGGVRVRHYTGTADLVMASKRAPAPIGRALAAAAKAFAGSSVPFDAYFDDRGRLCKVRHRFDFANKGHTVEVASTILLFGFGTPVKAGLPPKDQIYAGTVQ
ncbi:hypothetical protein AB0M87_30260 [Streptomyces sp. NPDC051320]|uniref:hypothetical protein n=1 Tax=Streptomyces sp. NPDC051320 TaxID=3154644 RepID=UPI00344839B4